jgi:cysteine-rich repeat protein
MRNSMLGSGTTLALVVAGIVGALLGGPGAAEEPVTLCHFPPGNPVNMRTIAVGASAVAAHYGHGDLLGACPNGFGRCGDGVVQGTEGCDPPDFADRTCEDVLGVGATGAPACTEACQLAAGNCQLCGNAIREGTEECDDGNDNPADGCNLCVIVEDEQD